RRISLPDEPFVWITFFTKPADKGREVMLEYNERAAVSRVLIPALIKKLQLKTQRSWNEAIQSFRNGSLAALDIVEDALSNLPATISIEELRSEYPHAFSELDTSFPALSRAPLRWPLQIRDRAMHHVG